MNTRLFAGISGTRLAVILLLAGTGVLGFGPGAHAAGEVDVRVALNPAAGELPEGITVPSSGPQRNRIFFSLAPGVQVLRVKGSSYEPWATIADPTNRLGLGLATDGDGHIYWAVGALGPGSSSPPGIYKIPPHGGMATLLTPPDFPAALPDGIDIIGEKAYWTDAILGTVNVTDIRTGATRLWSDDPLLFGNPAACGGGPPFPLGANGISHHHHTIYVMNSNYGRVLRIPITSHGDAGTVGVVAESCADLGGLDGVATDTDGTLLATRQPTSSIVRIWPHNGRTKVVYAGAPLDGPASDFIWQAPDGTRKLLITNSTLGSPPGGPGPSIVSIDLGGGRRRW